MKSLTAILLVIALDALHPGAHAAAHAMAPAGSAQQDRANAKEQELLDAFYPLTEIAGPLGMRFSTVIITDADAGDSPLAMTYHAGVCKLVVQVRHNPTYAKMLATRGRYAHATILRAMLTHEMGHCYRRFFGQSAGYAQETAAPSDNTHAARGRAPEGDHDDELSADLFALAWSAAYNPGEFDDVYAFLQEMRFTLLPEDTAGRYASREELAAGLKLRPAAGPLNPRVLPRMALLFLN